MRCRFECNRILVIVFFVYAVQVSGQDSDGDGLLDLIDLKEFSPSVHGEVGFVSRGIEDLDGANLLTGVQSLLLSDNLIASIENGDFSGLSDLHGLDLSGNRLTSVESESFTGLNSLKILLLSDNQLTNIETSDSSLSELNYLDLRGNRITRIVNGGFSRQRFLQDLWLSDNQVSSIESGAFARLGDLQNLYLQNNQISNIDNGSFAGLTSLQRLELSENQLAKIGRSDFAGLSELGHLGLWGNEITTIESETFLELADLQNLFLYDNRLTRIERDDFLGLANLQKLNLSGNRIDSIESGAFAGMTQLERLNLLRNPIKELNFTAATFENLTPCRSVLGFCVQNPATTSVILDDATLNRDSFAVIVDETDTVKEFSLVSLRFSGEHPTNMSRLLGIASLDKLTVDQSLFTQYADEFSAFDAMDGKSVLVVPGLCDIDRNTACDVGDVNSMIKLVTDGLRTQVEYAALIQRQSPDGFNTFFGDANLDGEFNSGDLVKVFAAAEYEDSIENNSTWEDGDWDLDGDFTTSDLVVAFQDGGYENGPRPVPEAVPESSGTAILILATVMILLCGTSRRRR